MPLYDTKALTTLFTAIANALTGVAPNNGAGTGNGVIYLFNGTPPVDEDAAVDITSGSTTATYLGKIVSNTVGPVGLSFGAISGNVMPKHPSETWGTGNLAAFLGQLHASSSAAITFMRFCTLADDGHSANPGTYNRVQLSVALIGSGPSADVNLTNATATVGSPFVLSAYQFQ